MFKERTSCPGYLLDVCDGQVYKDHPLFSVDKNALQLIIYTDDVETVNPLGSYRGYHKLCKTYSVSISNVILYNIMFLRMFSF